MFQAFKTFFRKMDIRGNGKKKMEITLYIFTRPIDAYDILEGTTTKRIMPFRMMGQIANT